MNLQSFASVLAAHPDAELLFQFPSGQHLAEHFHVTEIGKVTKEFIDCGGTRRSLAACVLQTLVANDTQHRLTAGKLASVIQKARQIPLTDDLSMEAEIQLETIGLYELQGGAIDNGKLRFDLAPKQTACLAPDVCKIDVLPVIGQSCCGDESDCC